MKLYEGIAGSGCSVFRESQQPTSYELLSVWWEEAMALSFNKYLIFSPLSVRNIEKRWINIILKVKPRKFSYTITIHHCKDGYLDLCFNDTFHCRHERTFWARNRELKLLTRMHSKLVPWEWPGAERVGGVQYNNPILSYGSFLQPTAAFSREIVCWLLFTFNYLIIHTN